jgi:hypothetical protein
MGDDLLGKLVVALLGLIGSWLFWHLKDGGWRARVRRDIREELELLHLLETDGRYPETATLMAERLGRAVAAYERQPKSNSEAIEQRLVATGMLTSVVVLGVLILQVQPPFWVTFAVALAMGGATGFIASRMGKKASEKMFDLPQAAGTDASET